VQLLVERPATVARVASAVLGLLMIAAAVLLLCLIWVL
jgi:hypothetical protein